MDDEKDLNNASATDEEILSMLNQDIASAESLQQELRIQREQFYKNYRFEPYGNEQDGWSSSVAPIIFNHLHGSMPSLMEIFDEDFFVIRGDNEDRAKKLQKLLYVQMFHKQDGFKAMYDFLYNCNLYHYGVLKVYKKEDYDLEQLSIPNMDQAKMQMLIQQPDVQVTKYDEVGVIDPNTGQENTTYENVKAVRRKVTFSGPFFECVPPWEFYFTRDAKVGAFGTIDARLVYHEVERDLDYIRKKEKAGIYRPGSYDKVKEKHLEQSAEGLTDKDTILTITDNLSTDSDQVPEENKEARKVTIKECYYRYDIDGDGLLEPCIIHRCDDVLLSITENPYGRPPFRVGSVYPEPHKVIGIAPAKILENDQKVMTNLLRLIQDAAAVCTYRNPVTNDPRMFTNLQVRKPFSVILGDPEKLGEIKITPPTDFILKAYEMLKGENEEKTGQTRYNQGLDADSLNKTATGISLISTASAKRMRMMAKLLGKGPIKGLIKDFIFINQKWPAPQEQMRILGSQLQVNKDDLYGDYDVEIDIGVGPAEKQAAANQIDLLVQWMMQAGLNLGVVTPIHVLRAVRRKYKLLNVNVDDLLLTEEEFMKEQQAKAQQPSKPQVKEILDVDRIFPMLSRKEQMQVLSLVGISPDEKATVRGLPAAEDVLKSQNDQQWLQLEAMKSMQSAKEKEIDQRIGVREIMLESKHKQLDRTMAAKERQNNGQ